MSGIFIFDKTVDNYVIRLQQYINTFNKTNNNYELDFLIKIYYNELKRGKYKFICI